MPDPPSQPHVSFTRTAPLPTPSPWAADAPVTHRCPFCAATDPGERVCRRCGQKLVVKTRKRRPHSVTLMNLFVVLFGRGPLALAVLALYRNEADPLITPWSIYLTATLPLIGLIAGGLWMRWRWAWFAGAAFALVDLLAQIGLQLAFRFHAVIPLTSVLIDLIVLGLLLLVYDEVRIDIEPITLPPEHALPKTAIEAFNVGAGFSKAGQWYLAAQMWRRAVALHHSEARYRRALGLAYLHLRERAAAVAELRAALDINPDDQQARQLLQAAEQEDRNAAKR